MFAQRLKELRLEKGLSQQELAEKLNISGKTVSGYENNVSQPNLDLLIEMARLFNVSVDYILGLSNVKTVDSNIKAINEFTGLSEEAIKTLDYFNHISDNNLTVSDFGKPEWCKRSVMHELNEFLESYSFYEALSYVYLYRINRDFDLMLEDTQGEELNNNTSELKEAIDYLTRENYICLSPKNAASYYLSRAQQVFVNLTESVYTVENNEFWEFIREYNKRK